jgi:hypothetical protein
MLGLTVPHVGVDEVIASAVCCGALWSQLARNRHADAVAVCPLLKDQRNWLGRGSKSEK